MAPVDLAEISFFDLDRLFTESHKALQRKIRRKRRKKQLSKAENKEGASEAIVEVVSPSRSRSPPTKRLKFSKVPAFGGFTDEFDITEKCVVVSGVPPASDEKALYILFSKCGTVSDVQILANRLEQRTGIAVVEFQEEEATTRATLMGPPLNELHGSYLQVIKTETKIEGGPQKPKQMMTRAQFTQQVLSGLKSASGAAQEGPHMRKLHIKNLRPVVTEDDMRGIFKPFGEFEEFKMGEQECWITFQNHNDAQDAMSSMQGFQLVGQELQITMQSIEVTPPPTMIPPPPAETLEQQMSKDTDFNNASGGDRIDLMKKLMSGAPGTASGPPLVPPPPPPAAGGLPPPPPAPGGAGQALPPTPKPGGPTARTLLLQNMFSPTNVNLQKDPKFYEEIREDTQEECSKFGKVLHVTVDPRGATGVIYVLYETAGQRQAAELALNGRWFEGKKILAAGIDDAIWQALASQAGPGK
jgi:RNA-binding protein 39